MNIKDFIENMRGCEYITFTLPNIGETTVQTIECQEIVDALEKATPKEPTIIKLDSKIQIGSVTFNKDCTVYKCQCKEFIKYKQIYCDVCGSEIIWEG